MLFAFAASTVTGVTGTTVGVCAAAGGGSNAAGLSAGTGGVVGGGVKAGCVPATGLFADGGVGVAPTGGVGVAGFALGVFGAGVGVAGVALFDAGCTGGFALAVLVNGFALFGAGGSLRSTVLPSLPARLAMCVCKSLLASVGVSVTAPALFA